MVPYVIATAVLYVLDRLLRIVQDAGTLGRNARVRVKLASRVGGTGSVLQVRIPRRRWLDWFTRRAVRTEARMGSSLQKCRRGWAGRVMWAGLAGT